jgi:hypothetical protein
MSLPRNQGFSVYPTVLKEVDKKPFLAIIVKLKIL